MSFNTPLSKVRGLGSAKSGTEHFWHQRLTGAANVFLTIGILIIGIQVWGKTYAATIAYFQSPVVAIVTMLFILNSAWHMKLGMQVIIEDYVPQEGKRIILLVLSQFFCVLVAFCGVYALAKINFGM